ncbi:hypothetical protein LVJ94_01205 [Pendulispora rubella]|uniref:Glyoxalase n=1 Tax=Pendulispora rubella TaxID=2741070 RepID=A0ABZ2L9L9_9BACT
MLATTIPVLPCVSAPETLDFYRLLGFEVTHKQSAPYVYLAFRRDDVHLHFHGREGLKREESLGICLVMVDEVEPLHGEFAASLRGAHGRLPISGIPRIARFRKGQTRFTVVDPSGNSIIFIRRAADSKKKDKPAPTSRLARAINMAEHTRVSQNDDGLAAQTLDAALARNEPAPPIDRARALALRAELAVALGETKRLAALRAELATIDLSAEERERYRDELEAADALERTQQ